MSNHWLEISLCAARERAGNLQDALTEAGALAVTLQECHPDAPLFEPTPGETPLWEELRITGLFAPDTEPEQIEAQLLALQGELPNKPASRLVEDRDWVSAWMEHSRPMRFGRRLWVCPGGQEPANAPPNAVVIRLDPGLAFGTGTHPSTALCLDWLDSAALEGTHVIDYGCGSGLLGIAALKLGAERVTAVDIDPQALTATRENARRNGVSEKLETCDTRERPPFQANILMANILSSPLIALAPLLAGMLLENGWIVLSGILSRQAEAVTQPYRAWFRMQEPAELDGWTRLTGQALPGL